MYGSKNMELKKENYIITLLRIFRLLILNFCKILLTGLLGMSGVMLFVVIIAYVCPLLVLIGLLLATVYAWRSILDHISQRNEEGNGKADVLLYLTICSLCLWQ